MVKKSADARDCASTFLQAFKLRKGSTVSLIGAGGKTSLLFQLAREARDRGDRVLVTTTTKLEIPDQQLYDAIDLSGNCFLDCNILCPGIYLAGTPAQQEGKIAGCNQTLLQKQGKLFDLILIEADGAARKSLKGWHHSEPVIVDFTSHTIGVLDISTIGKCINERLVHRMEIFTTITGCKSGQIFTLAHLHQLVTHRQGLFGRAVGATILYLNKTESTQDLMNFLSIKRLLGTLKVIAGSIQQNIIYA